MWGNSRVALHPRLYATCSLRPNPKGTRYWASLASFTSTGLGQLSLEGTPALGPTPLHVAR